MTTPRTATLIREYKHAKAYARDAARLARDGWQPQSTVTLRGGPRWWLGAPLLLAFILPGVLVLLFARKTKLVVTYTRAID